MSSQPDPHKESRSGSQPSEQFLGDRVRKLLAAIKLDWVSRRSWFTLALSLLVVASALAIGQLHWPLPPHEPWGFLSVSWWTHPVEFNQEAALPQFHRRLEVVAVQSDRRVWVAGEAGFLALSENDGLEWKELKYDYDAKTGALRKNAPEPSPSGSSAAPKASRFDFHLVPYAFAEIAPAGIVASPRSLTFNKPGETHPLTLTNETRSPAYFNSISSDPPSVFSVENGCKLIEPGQKCVLSIRFNASSGTYKGQLVVRMELSGSSSSRPVAVYIDLLGIATAANTGVDPKSNVRTAPVNTNGSIDLTNSTPIEKGQPNSAPSNAAQTKPASSPAQKSGTETGIKGKNEAAANKAPDRRPAEGNVTKPANAVLSREQLALAEAANWKPPAQLGTILAMEWSSAAEGRMITADAVIYATSDGGETWQAQRPDSRTTTTAVSSIGEKDLEVRRTSGGNQVAIVGRRIPEPTKSAVSEDRIVSIARDAARNSVWLVRQEPGQSVRTLQRSSDGIHFFNASRIDDAGVYWRLPAPWYWFGVLPLVLLAAAAAAAAGGEAGKVQESVSNIAISDRPLEPGEPDAMNLNALAQGLSLFLRNKSTKPPLVIAVNGDWGTGKSSLMNLLQNDLQRRGARAVWFNAWHHQEEKQLLAALLQTVRKKAVPSWYTRLGLWLRVQLIVKRWRQYWLPFAILFAAAMFLISLAIDIHHARSGLLSSYTDLWVKAYKDFEKSDILPSWLKHASLYTTILGALYALNGVRKAATAFGANPASLLASISGSGRIKDLEAQTSFRQQFAAEFRQVVDVLGSRRLLIVIDDLDRCQPEKVGEVLETVNFLVSSADCFVVLGLARPIVEHCVGLGFAKIVDSMPPKMLGLPENPEPSEGKKRETFARRYLDKLVQLELSLPQLTTDQARSLMGAEPAAHLSDEARRKQAELRRRRMRIEQRLRTGLHALWSWAVPATVCFVLAFFLWEQAHSLAASVTARIERQLQSQGAGGPKAASVSSAAASPPANPAAPKQASAAPAPAATLAAPSAPAPAAGPAVQAGSAPQPAGWIQSWPALLVLIWVLWFSYDAALRRAQLVSKDSPLFRAALDVWSPLVMSVMNTPRAAKRFLNRVRYLAMRQRALAEKHKPSLLDRFCVRVSEWFTSGSGEEAPTQGLAPDPAGASAGPMPRSLGAAAAVPTPSHETVPEIPESLLVALAAIELVPGGWKGLAARKWEGLVDARCVELLQEAILRHQKDLGDWGEIHEHMDTYLMLCSEIVTH